MGYKHIENLYNNLWFLNTYSEVYALEKIHGTSATIKYKNGKVRFHPGGEKYETFISSFKNPKPEQITDSIIKQFNGKNIIFYGEAYGGKQQNMSATYGLDCKFVVFDIKYDNKWLDVEEAENYTLNIGLEFVHYKCGPNTIDWLNKQRDAPSVQAQRNGMGNDKIREGIVIRAVEKQTCMFKYKRSEFCETNSHRESTLVKDMAIQTNAKEIVDEWIVPMRLSHVKDRLLQEMNERSEKRLSNRDIPKFMNYLMEDIKREAKGEIKINNNNERIMRKLIGEIVREFISLQ